MQKGDKGSNAAKRANANEARQADGEKGRQKAGTGMKSVYYIIAVLVALDLLLFLYHPSAGQPFYTFESNFHSAKSVAIYMSAYNGTVFASTEPCATSIVESIVSSSKYHRNASTINFFVLNQTACFTSAKALGIVSNYTQEPISDCLNVSKSMPSIFINYSDVNSTIITPDKLVMQGDYAFLSECGVAPALS
ncbi:MAG: hypothetical protein M1360_00810 [Candidatus Marsarchaeota archaeon]|jgi:hypothetical protein|nr:hypothetical protein [Candidatus Marsarchaeota archaeon]MCL5418467.1 hypothetical protein [Candidatus Marsarchaeota archaeon]